MKKVSLLSLLAVLAVSTAANANVEDPLYAPAEGKFYSKTEVNKQDSAYNISEEIGYGITNRFFVAGTIDYQNDTDSDSDGLAFWKLAAKYRLSAGKVITNIYVDYAQGIDEDVISDDTTILNAGLQIGTRTAKYSIAADAGLNNIEYGNDNFNNIVIGLEGQYTFDDRVSANLGFKYTMNDEDWDSDDNLAMTAQVNYQKAGLWSLAYTRELKHDDVDDVWAIKYGVQF